MANWLLRQTIVVREGVSALLRSMRHSDDGQGLVEYALILVLVAVLLVVSLRFLQPAINVQLNNVTNSF